MESQRVRATEQRLTTKRLFHQLTEAILSLEYAVYYQSVKRKKKKNPTDLDKYNKRVNKQSLEKKGHLF